MKDDRDPLCSVHTPPRCPSCRALYTARLQGPVTNSPRHAPFCWCPRCVAASDRIHGTADA